MNIPKTIPVLFVSLVAVLCATVSATAETKPKAKQLIDFTVQDVERSGAEIIKVNKQYEYAFGDWEKKIVYLENRGLLVDSAGGKGGLGGALSGKLKDFNSVFLVIEIGNRNQGKTLGVSLTDADGTEATWNFPLVGKPRGVGLVCSMALAQPDKEEKPGKVPGLNKEKIRKWAIKGDWQDAKFEVLLVKFGAMP